MTCIVGIVEDGCVYMGGDSASSNGQNLSLRMDPKVFHHGQFLFGFTSSWRMGQLLAHGLRLPRLPAAGVSHKWMCTRFVNAVRKCLKAGGWIKKKDEREDAGVFLVGVKGKLYQIESDLQVGQFYLPYTAIGGGENYALGSLHSTVGKPPKRRIQKAMEAAAEFSAFVRPPFTVLDTKRPRRRRAK